MYATSTPAIDSERAEPDLDRVNRSPLVQDGVLIHLVATETGHYVYDTYSNCFFSADAISHEILAALQRETPEARVDALLALRDRFADDELMAALDRLDDTRGHDVLKPLPADLQLQLEESSLLASGRGRFRTLVLEVTEACNLRCSYCVYSGDYEHERVHTTRHMSEETAFQAIDLFLAHAEPTERPVINFYGGEALLRKSLVQACMAYAREKDPAVDLSITTNAFLLDPDWIPVLVKYDISLFVSVDGPKKIHDRFRVLGSQRGTFDRVIANLETLAEAEPDYFSRRVHFTVVMTSAEDFEAVAKFFNSRPIVAHGNIRVGTVSSTGLSEQGKDNWLKQFDPKHTAAARERYIDALARGDLSGVRFEHKAFGGALGIAAIRDERPVESKWTKTGPCTIGGLRLFVNAEGQLRHCEKTQRLPAIGTVDTGFDLDAVQGIRDDFLSAAVDCTSCWALRLCDVCYVHVYDGKNGARVDIDVKRQQCDMVRRTRHSALTMLAQVMERRAALDSAEAADE